MRYLILPALLLCTAQADDLTNPPLASPPPCRDSYINCQRYEDAEREIERNRQKVRDMLDDARRPYDPYDPQEDYTP